MKLETAAMANLSDGCTSTNAFVLLCVAVCIIDFIVATSAPTVHIRQATAACMLDERLTGGVGYLTRLANVFPFSYTMYC